MLIAFVDSSSACPWDDCGHRFVSLDGPCRARGHEPWFIDAGISTETRPIVAGRGRESDVRPLIESTRLVALVKTRRPDVCVVPLRGGLAHGLLMARACGELSSSLSILTLAEEPSKSVALRSDMGCDALRYIVADAMERFCLEKSDLLLAEDNDELAWIASLKLGGAPPIARRPGLVANHDLVVATGERPAELVFVGPFDRMHRVDVFIDAAEHVLAAQQSSVRRLTFLGPIDDAPAGLGREWLGRRALRWGFPFRVIETRSFSTALDHVLGAASLAFVADASLDARSRLAESGAKMLALGQADSSSPFALRDALMLVGAVDAGRTPAADFTRWMQAIEAPSTKPLSPTSDATDHGLSVCILHHDRPALLERAVESVLGQVPALMSDQVEIIVFDNGSQTVESGVRLDELSQNQRIKVVRAPQALAHPSAMNAMAALASRPHLVFLDDDNCMGEGGVQALFQAAAKGAFDVVVSNLHLFDSDATDVSPSALMTFVGPALTAGLFFNAFGDTCMMFRRRSFEAIGGFLDIGVDYPAPDWLLLARAQAAGLSIGVLQEPGFLYRRDLGAADLSWRKYDQHALRTLLLRHYGEKYDGALLAKLSQSLVLDMP